VTFDAITAGITVLDTLTKFDKDDNCNGVTCIIKTQLQGLFYPINGDSSVNIQGLATLQLGEFSLRHVLAKVVPGDRSLQETSSLEEFSIEVKTTTASDMSGTTKKRVVTLSMIMTIFVASSLRFFY
jgi:hypothetical protein